MGALGMVSNVETSLIVSLLLAGRRAVMLA